MKYLVKRGLIANESGGCAIVPIYSSHTLDETSKQIDIAYQGLISRALSNSDINGAAGETLLLHPPADAVHGSILLVGCGPRKDLNVLTLNKIATQVGARLKKLNVSSAVSTLNQIKIKDLTQKAIMRMLITGIEGAWYQYGDTFSEKKPAPKLQSITWMAHTQRDVKPLQTGLSQGIAISEAIGTTRTLGNLPGNICTPTYLECTTS